MTTKTTRVKKPDAEVIGSFKDVMLRGKCDDERDLYAVPHTYVLAKSELEAWQALRSELGTLEKLTKAKMHELITQYLRQLIEEQNNEPTETDHE